MMLGPLVGLSIKGISPVCSITACCMESMLRSPPSNKRPLGSSGNWKLCMYPTDKCQILSSRRLLANVKYYEADDVNLGYE